MPLTGTHSVIYLEGGEPRNFSLLSWVSPLWNSISSHRLSYGKIPCLLLLANWRIFNSVSRVFCSTHPRNTNVCTLPFYFSTLLFICKDSKRVWDNVGEAVHLHPRSGGGERERAHPQWRAPSESWWDGETASQSNIFKGQPPHQEPGAHRSTRR